MHALHPSIYLPQYTLEWADLPCDRQCANYITHLQSARLNWPGDCEGGNYLTHFLGQKIIEGEEYDRLNTSFLA